MHQSGGTSSNAGNKLTDSAPDRVYRVGDVIGGGYRVLKVVEGGLGFVYVVEPRIAKQYPCILKAPKGQSNPSVPESFRIEAETWVRLGKHPRDAEDAHRQWEEGAEALDATLARHDDRRLSKALTFSAGGAVHCIKTRDAGIALRGARVTVRHYLDGRMDVVFKDRVLPYTTVRKLPAAAAIEDDKTLDARVDAIVARQRQEPPNRGCGRLGP